MWVYKGARRDEAYLYLPRADHFDDVPRELLEALGTLSLVVDFELRPERRLARADAGEVLASLESRGYYLQMPPIEAPRPERPH